MRILVTGVGGFVGGAVAAAAAASGHDVTGTTRPGGSDARGGAYRVVAADLHDRDGLGALMGDVRPQVLVHAAWSGLEGAARRERAQVSDNLAASLNLLDAGIAAGLGKFVGIGSQAEYGAIEGRVDEERLPVPSSMYGAAKLAAMVILRQVAAQAGVGFAWLRLFAAYGPGDRPNWLIPSLAAQMLAGQSPRMTEGRQRWDYLYIDDVARGVLAAATAEAEGVFNLGSGRPETVRRIAEMIRDRAAPDLALRFGEVAYGPAQIWHMEAGTERLEALGWSPQVSLEAGLDRTVEALRRGRDA